MDVHRSTCMDCMVLAHPYMLSVLYLAPFSLICIQCHDPLNSACVNFAVQGQIYL